MYGTCVLFSCGEPEPGPSRAKHSFICCARHSLLRIPSLIPYLSNSNFIVRRLHLHGTPEGPNSHYKMSKIYTTVLHTAILYQYITTAHQIQKFMNNETSNAGVLVLPLCSKANIINKRQLKFHINFDNGQS